MIKATDLIVGRFFFYLLFNEPIRRNMVLFWDLWSDGFSVTLMYERKRHIGPPAVPHILLMRRRSCWLTGKEEKLVVWRNDWGKRWDVFGDGLVLWADDWEEEGWLFRTSWELCLCGNWFSRNKMTFEFAIYIWNQEYQTKLTTGWVSNYLFDKLWSIRS